MLVYIGIGGALGAISRYYLSQRIDAKKTSFYPLGTFIINLSGAFLLGFLSGMGLSSGLNTFLADGFLGAFTTFSTFMREGYTLLDRHVGRGAAYILITLILGICGYLLGFGVATGFKRG